ncbi:MAG TPA: hypothetical protein VFW19_08260 [Allosphingosinicella sp.]|nr:hypothetical protein [Allosphingosinicella sp.]
MTRGLWAELGIAPTKDETAIRKAYAKRLKAIDVEAAPQAFIALRRARDRALAQARPAPAELAAAGGDGPPFAIEPEGDWTEPGIEPAAPEPDPFAPIEAILFDERTKVDGAKLEALTRALLDDSAMANLAHAAATEQRLAWTAAATIPRSDPILDLLVTRFGWDERGGDWDLAPPVRALVERRRALAFLAEIERPGHPHHRAYLELYLDKGPLGWNRFWVGRDVRRLLDTIRAFCPAAEDGLDPARLALWNEFLGATVQRRLRRGALICWGLYVLLRLYLALFGGS